MLILAKSILGLMLGFLLSVLLGLVLIPLLRKFKFGQNISSYVAFSHKSKQGTPTIGGLIFIIPTFVTMIILYLRGSLEITFSLMLVMFIFIAYALLGFVDDYIKIKSKTNDGLSVIQKLVVQVVIAIIFFYVYMRGGGEPVIWMSSIHINIHLGWFYGLFILFMMVGSANAVNITDGLDGLAGGLSAIAFLAFGIISWGTYWAVGYQEIAIFCFILTGSLLGFLVYNTHPAKVFMGDTGSMALGATLAVTAILTRHELLLLVVGGVFVIETLSVIIQTLSIRLFKRKVFLFTPLHHHFEKLGWLETDIVKLFWTVGFMLGMGAIYYAVWL
ncbi:MAG: phospho-N-acetylmuramoyl-pentapeptide-transferase [Bacilli bacterium]